MAATIQSSAYSPATWLSSGRDGLRQRVLTALADAGPGRIRRHRRDVAPAALALRARRAADSDARSTSHPAGRRPRSLTSTSDTMNSMGSCCFVSLQQRKSVTRRRDVTTFACSECRSVCLFSAVQSMPLHLVADPQSGAPRRRAAWRSFRRLERGRWWEEREVHRLFARRREDAATAHPS